METEGPDVTYWFGPFVTRRGLERELGKFLEDIGSEQPSSMHRPAPLLRTKTQSLMAAGVVTLSRDGMHAMRACAAARWQRRRRAQRGGGVPTR